MKVCHLTSVHAWSDTRIFYRECVSLRAAGHEVHLVAINAVNEVMDGVQVHAVSMHSGSRLKRATIGCWKVLQKAWSLNADVYHFHDPELIWAAALLKWKGKKVVFDIHENIRQQILDKDWLPLRKLVAAMFYLADTFAVKMFRLVLAEESYLPYYQKLGGNCTVVQNFPDLDSFKPFIVTDRSASGILYVGGVTRIRGIFDMINGLALMNSRNIDFTFHCIGPVSDETRKEIEDDPGFRSIAHKVKFYGRLTVKESYEISKQCVVGLSVLHPVGNYLNSYSTKVFEYMAVGLPVIVSRFPLYGFVESSASGFTVEPGNTGQIADGIERILKDPVLRKRMGEQGIACVNERFSWTHEREKLLKLYQSLDTQSVVN